MRYFAAPNPTTPESLTACGFGELRLAMSLTGRPIGATDRDGRAGPAYLLPASAEKARDLRLLEETIQRNRSRPPKSRSHFFRKSKASSVKQT
jgi:hypothetical protein